MVNRSRVAPALLLLAALGSACTEPKCEPITGCDIRDEGCQRAALRLAACLRGSPADSDVRVEVVDYDTYLDEEERDARQDEPTAESLDMREGLAAFELRPPYDAEADARRSSAWVGGFYDPATDTITVLDRGKSSDAAEERGNTILLVHEMLHALQDADGTLDRLWSELKTHDQMTTATALIEGEATLFEDQGSIEALGYDFGEVSYGRALRAYRELSLDRMRDAEDLFEAVRSGVPYAFGASYLHARYKGGDIAALREVLDAPPQTARELLAKRSANKVRAPVPFVEGATLVGVYHLGPFFVQGFLNNIHQEAPDVLAHVVDDVFSVQRLESGRILAAWRIRFDGSVPRNQAHAFMEARTSRYLTNHPDSGELIIVGKPAREVDFVTYEEAPEVDFGLGVPEASARFVCPHDPRWRSALAD